MGYQAYWREELGQGEQGQGQDGGVGRHPGGMLGGKYQREVTLKGEDDLEEERSLGLSLIDILEGDEGQDVAEELVVCDLAEWELLDA